MDAVFFVAGDVDALVYARRARVLTATSRELDVLGRGAIPLDALMGSGEDEAERYQPGDLDPAPALVVTTSGGSAAGCSRAARSRRRRRRARSSTRTAPGTASRPGSRSGSRPGSSGNDAVGFAARCGAAALTGRGVAPRHVPLA